MVEIASLAIILTSIALVTIVIDERFIPPETLYIGAGLLLAALIAPADTLLFAEAGAAFLVFYTAMNLRVGSVRNLIDDTAPVIAIHTTFLLITAAISLWYGMSFPEAILIGLTCAIGSSMLAIDVIEEQVDRRLLHGRLTESIAFTQDLIVLMVLGLLASWPDGTSIQATAIIGAALILALLGRETAGKLLARLEDDEDTTMLLGLGVLWALTAALLGIQYGIIIAPVAAGILLSSHQDNFTLLETVGPIKDLFVTVFFVALGSLLIIPPGAEIGLAAVLLVATTVIRPLLTVAGLRLQGIDRHTSFRTAVQLDQVSEIVLLLGLVLATAGTISDTVVRAITLAAAASFITSSYTTRHADNLYGLITAVLEPAPDPAIDRADHTLLGGYGRLGRALATELDDPVIIDNDPQAIARAEEDGLTTIRGDMRDPTTWDRAGAQKADMLILTTADDAIAGRLASRGKRSILLTDTDSIADRIEDLTGVRAFSKDGMTTDQLLADIKAILDAEQDAR